MEKFDYKNESEEIPISEAFDKLIQVADILRGMGMDVTDRLISKERLESGFPFPIVSDGCDGIRAEYSKRGGLVIWFTNGFENPENPQRKEIEKRLKEIGL